MEKSSRGHSRAKEKNTVSKMGEQQVRQTGQTDLLSEDRIGRLENRVIEYNQVDAKENISEKKCWRQMG